MTTWRNTNVSIYLVVTVVDYSLVSYNLYSIKLYLFIILFTALKYYTIPLLSLFLHQ